MYFSISPHKMKVRVLHCTELPKSIQASFKLG